MARLTGLSELKAAFRAWPVEARREIKTALRRNAVELVAAQKALAPVDTGALRKSIKWRPYTTANKDLGVMVTAGGIYMIIVGNTARLVIDKASPAYYARFVEFGTAPGFGKPGPSGIGAKRSRDSRGRFTFSAPDGRARIGSGGAKQGIRGRLQYRRHPGSKPKPFFFPAYRLMKRRMTGRVTRAMNKAAKRISGL